VIERCSHRAEVYKISRRESHTSHSSQCQAGADHLLVHTLGTSVFSWRW